MFDALDPSSLPDAVPDVFTFAPNIMPLAKRFGMDELIVNNEYAQVLTSLLEDHGAEYCVHKANGTTITFWSHFLNTNTVPWGFNIKQLVKIALTLPVSTADVERGFSFLMHTRYDRRSRLTAQHLNDILFLRINGPAIENFDARKYAKVWVDGGGQHTDDPRGRKARPGNELPESNIF